MRELKKILFLCTGNSCRSQMAEGIAKKFTCFQAFSAGTKKSVLDPYAVKVMSEIKIDISDQFSKTINELEDKDFEYVFTLCSDAEENCPVLFKGKTIHIGFEDPPKLTEDIDDDIIVSEFKSIVKLEDKDIKLIKSYTINEALPTKREELDNDENIYFCGDWKCEPSIDGAIKSGRLCAEEINKSQ